MRRLLASLALVVACASTPTAPTSPPAAPPARAAAAATAWWNGAVVYEVFVRSFSDSNGDGKGDLAGLIAKLDYLNDGDPATDTDLGVDAIWLMPIYPSPSYHGYDVTDYDGVNPDYGTAQDMDRLIAECHRRGIKVILDFVPNHTSSSHPWFLDATAPTGAHRDWYVWSTTDLGWRQPFGGAPTWYRAGQAWYYAVFWSGMPDLNWRNAAVRDELAAAALRWLARGVDGFRLDAVRYLVENGAGLQQDQPETHAYLKELAARLRAARPDVLLVGEAWADTDTIASYFGDVGAIPGGDELPLTFDFPLADAVVKGVASGDASGAAAVLDAVARAYPAGAGDAPFLTNHDQARVATQLAADPGRLRLAAAILLTLQGTPFIYYGEELGMQNGPCAGDECKRTPMAWDATAQVGFTSGTPWFEPAPGAAQANVAAETSNPGSLLSRYRQLVRVRQGSAALARGGTLRLPTRSGAALAYLRVDPTETVLVAHDLGNSGVTESLALPAAAAEPLLVDPGAALQGGASGWTVTLPSRGSGIWRLR